MQSGMTVRAPRRARLAVGAMMLVALVAACSGAAPTSVPTGAPAAASTVTPAITAAPATPPPTTAPSAAASGDVILATTTSTQDSGLFDILVPAFEQATACKVKTVAVGSGAALKLGQDGNADVLMVHSPAAEKTFMEGGYGVNRQLLMHNMFLVVGPPADPAGIKGMTDAYRAFMTLAQSGARFVSRGDGSGTEAKELAYWKALKFTPKAPSYIKSGQGMAATLQIASEKKAYTLTDNATWLATKGTLDLAPMVEKDPALLNIYHVIQVNPDKWPKVNAACAAAFSQFVLSPEGQKIIGDYGVDKFGEQLFVADAGKSEDSLSAP